MDPEDVIDPDLAARAPDAKRTAVFPDPEAAPLHWWDLLWQLIRFQFKLFLDGVRDLLLSPVALVAVLLGLVFEREQPDRYLRQLMHLGHRSDLWINLFGQYDRDADTADRLVEPLERAARAHFDAATTRRAGAANSAYPSSDQGGTARTRNPN